MKTAILMGGFICIVVLGYVYMNTAEAPEGMEETTTTTTDEAASESEASQSDNSESQMDGEVTGETVSNAMPVIGNDTVEEMIVEEMPDEKVFAVGGTNFSFDVKEIRVSKGDTVTINFTSKDGFHDWALDEFDAATERVQTEGKSSVTFVADTAGTFEYYCSVGQHRANGMVGTFIVE